MSVRLSRKRPSGGVAFERTASDTSSKYDRDSRQRDYRDRDDRRDDRSQIALALLHDSFAVKPSLLNRSNLHMIVNSHITGITRATEIGDATKVYTTAPGHPKTRFEVVDTI